MADNSILNMKYNISYLLICGNTNLLYFDEYFCINNKLYITIICSTIDYHYDLDKVGVIIVAAVVITETIGGLISMAVINKSKKIQLNVLQYKNRRTFGKFYNILLIIDNIIFFIHTCNSITILFLIHKQIDILS